MSIERPVLVPDSERPPQPEKTQYWRKKSEDLPYNKPTHAHIPKPLIDRAIADTTVALDNAEMHLPKLVDFLRSRALPEIDRRIEVIKGLLNDLESSEALLDRKEASSEALLSEVESLRGAFDTNLEDLPEEEWEKLRQGVDRLVDAYVDDFESNYQHSISAQRVLGHPVLDQKSIDLRRERERGPKSVLIGVLVNNFEPAVLDLNPDILSHPSIPDIPIITRRAGYDLGDYFYQREGIPDEVWEKLSQEERLDGYTGLSITLDWMQIPEDVKAREKALQATIPWRWASLFDQLDDLLEKDEQIRPKAEELRRLNEEIARRAPSFGTKAEDAFFELRKLVWKKCAESDARYSDVPYPDVHGAQEAWRESEEGKAFHSKLDATYAQERKLKESLWYRMTHPGAGERIQEVREGLYADRARTYTSIKEKVRQEYAERWGPQDEVRKKTRHRYAVLRGYFEDPLVRRRKLGMRARL